MLNGKSKKFLRINYFYYKIFPNLFIEENFKETRKINSCNKLYMRYIILIKEAGKFFVKVRKINIIGGVDVIKNGHFQLLNLNIGCI